jgi:hypothetical protein
VASIGTGAPALMDFPQLPQNFAVRRTGLPQFGHGTISPAGGGALAGRFPPSACVLPAAAFTPAGNVAPQLPQNFAPGRSGLPQLGQLIVDMQDLLCAISRAYRPAWKSPGRQTGEAYF